MSDEAVTVFDPDDIDENANVDELTSVQKAWRCRQVAVLFCYNHNLSEIADALEVQPITVKRWFESPECQRYIVKIQQSDIKLAQNSIRDVLPDFCERLKSDVRDDNKNSYKAMNLIAKIMGLTEGGKTKESTLTNYEQILRILVGDISDKGDTLPILPPHPVKLVTDASRNSEGDKKEGSKPPDDEDEEDEEIEF